MSVTVIEQVRKPDPELVAELERLLASAQAGNLRALLFVAYQPGPEPMRYGACGAYSLPDFAFGVKLMELEMDSIITRSAERE